MSDAHRHKLIFEHSYVANIVLDAQAMIVAMNPAAESLLGTSIRQAQHQKLDKVCPHIDISALNLEQMTLDQRVIRREILFEQPDKPSAIIDVIATKPEPDFLLLELYRRDSRIDVDENKANLLSRSENLLRGLAHEIKNPLGGIRGAAQLLEAEFENVHEFTQVIIAESDRLRSLIEQMLGPNRQAEKAWRNIHEITERVCVLLEAQKGADIELKRDYDVSIPDVFIDRDQLMQAVLNVAQNAFEALGDRGEIVFATRVLRNLTIDKVIHPLTVSLAISDNGPGIEYDNLADIFFPMITDKANGSGLGLSISQSLVKLNGGVLKCTSRRDPTCFEILLPLEHTEK